MTPSSLASFVTSSSETEHKAQNETSCFPLKAFFSFLHHVKVTEVSVTGQKATRFHQETAKQNYKQELSSNARMPVKAHFKGSMQGNQGECRQLLHSCSHGVEGPN